MRHLFTFVLLFLAFSFNVNAETINSLKKKQRQAKQRIEMTNRILRETQENQRSTEGNLKVLKNQISERQNLIGALNSEISLLDKNLISLSSQKEQLEQRLKYLRQQYAILVRHAYFFNQKHGELLYVFSSDNFMQAYRRIRYIQEYSDYRKQQTIAINEVAHHLGIKLNQLNKAKVEKTNVMRGKQVESKNLQIDQQNKEKMLKDLTAKEQDLQKKLKKQQEQADSINRKIEQYIAREIAAQQRKEREEAEKKKRQKATATKKVKRTKRVKDKNGRIKQVQVVEEQPIEAPSDESGMSKEELLISGGFQRNRGRLSMPAKGTIVGHFGVHPHPILAHVTVNNKGIYIQTHAGADATAVYDGVVTQVFSIPGSNNAVIVKHGNYRTVYANLTSTYVHIGSRVSARQRIGRIYVDKENNNKTELYFMMYNGSSLVNPESWLGR